MSCVGLLAIAAGASHPLSPSSTDDGCDGDRKLIQLVQPCRMIGGSLMMDAAEKVDKCLARLQSLQGTVSIPTPPVSATVSACISPVYSRSRSCIGSPRFEREEKEPVIRVHDILRFSDDFTGKISSLTQEPRGKYLRRLSRSKTEVFDAKKDPRDPHGEWKHWSSGAGDVHKVVSEILMASQIAKEITSMVNACLVNTEVGSSEDEKAARRSNRYKHKLKGQAFSSNKGTVISSSNRMLKKEDPMHKFRVVTQSDSSKRRHSSGRKEVLYPKSKLTADLIKSVDSTQELSSIERKMQSRRSPRGSASPRTSQEQPTVKTRSKVLAESSKAAATPCASIEESVFKSKARVTVETPRTGSTPRTSTEGIVRKTHVRFAGEWSGAAASPLASVEEPSARIHAGVASEPAWGVCEAREYPFSRNHARSAVSVESTTKDSVLKLHAGNGGTPRSSFEESLVGSKVTEPSRASKLRASADDAVLKRIRARVAASVSSHVPETTRASAEDLSLTRVRVDSSAEGPTENEPVLTRIRTTAGGAPEPLIASGTPRTAVDDPVLTRIRARFAAAAEPLRRSAEQEPVLKLRSKAAAAATLGKSGTTSEMWEAKEITNCYNSLRTTGESSKKAVNAALPSSSAVKKVRNSRSPPQASQTSSIGAVQSSTIWRYNQPPAKTPIYSLMPESSEQTHCVTGLSRSRTGRLAEENVAEGSSVRIRRPQIESVQEPVLVASTFCPSSSQFPAAVRKSSSIFVAETNVDSRIPETTSEQRNDAIHRSSAGEDNTFTTSNGSLKGGRNDDWFKKSLEATEISLGPSKLWKSGTNKAVLFSNPTFAPASPPGARPSGEKESSATPVREPSPRRSTSATRRMKEWVGNVLHIRRSVSPDVAGNVSTRKVVSLSPGRSLPSLITRLPSRGRKASLSAPRATVFPSSSIPKVGGDLPLPPSRQAQQLTASKLAELPAPPGRRQVMELKAQKEKMDRQAYQMAAQKLMMVEDWNRTVEPPAPFDKDVGLAHHPSGPVLYTRRQLSDIACNVKEELTDMECKPSTLDKGVVPNIRYSWRTETELPMDKRLEIANFKRGSEEEKEVGVLGVLSQRSKSMDQERRTIDSSKEGQKENIGPASAAVDSADRGGVTLRRTCSVNSSTSTIRAMSTGKIRTGPSFLKKAKEWMRTQTPFRDRPQKTIGF